MKLFLISFLLFASFSSIIDGQGITRVIERELVDIYHDYWVIYTDYPTNRPAFRAYIRFFNTHTAKAELEIDCSTYPLILFYEKTAIFRTTGHQWQPGDNYYVTIDEGAVFSTPTMNSSAYTHPKYWTFKAVYPPYAPIDKKL